MTDAVQTSGRFFPGPAFRLIADGQATTDRSCDLSDATTVGYLDKVTADFSSGEPLNVAVGLRHRTGARLDALMLEDLEDTLYELELQDSPPPL